MKFELIPSAQNDAVKHLVKLRDRRHREREQRDLYGDVRHDIPHHKARWQAFVLSVAGGGRRV